MKWDLVIGGTFFILALGAVVCVWAFYQDTQRTFDAYVPSASSTTKAYVENADSGAKTSTTASKVTEDTEPIIINTTTLSETQQSILKTFGHNSQTLIITPAMVVCAQDSVGKERLDEIMKGSAPSPLESVKLLACFKE